MSFVVKGQDSTFTPAPAGTHRAVCVDVIDLGVVATAFGPKHRARFVWEIDETNPEYDAPFLVFGTYNVSLHENSTMGGLLRQWRGKDFTPAELDGFDIENVLDAPCLLTVEHNPGQNGQTFANVAAAVPLARGMEPLKPSGGYVRQIDKTEKSKDVRSRYYDGPAPVVAENAGGDGASAQPVSTEAGGASFDDPDLPFAPTWH